MKNKKPKTKSDVDVIVEVLKDSKEFEKFLTDMENAYQNYEFCERNYIDPDEYGWWLEWVENIPNKFYVKLAKSILQKLKENRKEIAKEVEQKEGQIICQLHIETEYRKHNYEVESGQEIVFVSLDGKRIRIIPEIKFKEFNNNKGGDRGWLKRNI